ncbi:uncharacterized protein LOC128921662 [Zeugodacus cucurbitae]|uniref:uncharacterized protein LOC128921662 n=1 Tax=Zeugodacus cucurbitae TaxID=28588 RepID=UPI0023D931D7|nr:uncharacterized protein LOC128921662 [Zeugodacus cucurbitae]
MLADALPTVPPTNRCKRPRNGAEKQAQWKSTYSINCGRGHILEAPTPLANELRDTSNNTKPEREVNPEHKTKKRSGAARRAARKRRLLEAGIGSLASAGNPENNQTPRSEEEVQTPEDTISFKRTKYEATSQVSNEGASNSPTTPKTVTRDIVTSSGEEKAKRSSAETNNHFNYAVIDAERPGGSMSGEQQTKFEAAFSDGLMDLILSSSSDRSVFKIDTARFEKGVFRLAINTVEDVEAIRSMVEALPQLWDKSKLRLVSDEDVPRLQKPISSSKERCQ